MRRVTKFGAGAARTATRGDLLTGGKSHQRPRNRDVAPCTLPTGGPAVEPPARAEQPADQPEQAEQNGNQQRDRDQPK